ncbi:hypothetical protein PDIDSM_4079 [Penicillium digitatum]|nr:hypothetical protein PDIDSM_4079 [Penicillium digitatum]
MADNSTVEETKQTFIQRFRAWGDTAGISAAFSGLYLLLAAARRQPFMKKLGVRGVVRGATMGLALVNMVGGGLAYTLGRREEEEDAS